MPGNSGPGPSPERRSGAREALVAPVCVHVYVWVFMITLSLSPTLCLLTCDDFGRAEATESLLLVPLIQASLYFAQWRCSTQDLTYWEGLLAAAASVTTGGNLISLLRTLPLLLAVVLLSIWFALGHESNTRVRHACLRFCALIICIHKKRLRR